MHKFTINEFWFLILIIIGILNLFGINVDFDYFFELCTSIFLILFFLCGKVKINVFYELKKNIPFIVAFLIVAIFNKSSIGSLFTIITIFLLIITLKYIYLSRKFFDILFVINIVVYLLLVIISNNYYLIWQKNIGLTNPNTLCFLLVFINCFMTIYIKKYIKKNILYILLINLMTLISIYWLKSRLFLVVALIWIVLIIINSKYFFNKKIMFYFFITIVFCGVLMPKLYIELQNVIAYIKLLGINKPIYTGRELIWRQYYENVNNLKDIFLGLGTNVGDYSRNMHSSYLLILNNWGLFGLFFYIYTMKIAIFKNIENMKYISNYYCICALFIFLIAGCGETILFNIDYCIFVYLLLNMELRKD